MVEKRHTFQRPFGSILQGLQHGIHLVDALGKDGMAQKKFSPHLRPLGTLAAKYHDEGLLVSGRFHSRSWLAHITICRNKSIRPTA